MGSRSPTGSFDDAYEAGAACIYQTMDYLVAFRGAEYYEALCALHRELYGSRMGGRQTRYEEILWKQVKEGKSASQIGISLRP